MNDLPAADLLARFGTGLSQHARLITIETAQGSALPESLVAESMVAYEAVNDLFRFDIDALSVSAELDASTLLGEELTVTLLQPDGSRRAWHGMCTVTEHGGADGGMARYRLRLEPALRQLCLRHDSYIFHNKDARAIIGELLSDYRAVRCEFDLSTALAVRPICTQYGESDFAFFRRVLASEGLSWRFDHAPIGAKDRHGKHKLVIFDSRALTPAMPDGDTIRFHGVRATDTDDAIDRFSARRELRANAVAISSWEPSLLVAPASERHSALDAGELPALSIYDGSGERLVADRGQAERRTDVMLKALELENKAFDGEGAVRRLAAGHRFTLTQHERYGRGMEEFKVLSVRHEARNNFQPGLKSSKGIEGTYRNSFSCVRASVAIVPPDAVALRPVTAPGVQSALVVGLANSVATTTRDHQVRVQFPWQRGHRPNVGGIPHDTDAQGCAPGDDGSGTWMRVAEALAGPNWGTQFTPRLQGEVLVDFVGGDIDRPVVVSQLYNGADRPPFPAGADSGANHAGTLSGIHSHSFDGAGFNQWLLDDSAGQLRMRLATSCASTQLNLGYLIEHGPTSPQRGAHRGSGFELRTDAWAVMRGGEGVLLSTSARQAVGCSVESTQMDAAEALGCLKAGQQLDQALGDAARQQKALYSKDASEAQDGFIKQVDPQELGKHPGSVNGQIALKAKAGGRVLDAEAPVEKFGKPLVLMDSAAGVNWATPGSTVVYAGLSTQWGTQGDLHFAAGGTFSSVSGGASGLFTHGGGIQAIAANGPVSLQANTDQLEILTDKEVTVISVNDEIDIRAKLKIVLQAGQSTIILEDADITFASSGDFLAKGGQHNIDSGAKGIAKFAKLPDSRLKVYDEGFVVCDQATGEPIANLPYRITRGDGTYEHGQTDDAGRTHVIYSADIETLTIEFLGA